MNTKALISCALFSLFFVGTSAIAGDNDYFTTAAKNQTAEPFLIQNAFLLTSVVASTNKENEEAMNK